MRPQTITSRSEDKERLKDQMKSPSILNRCASELTELNQLEELEVYSVVVELNILYKITHCKGGCRCGQCIPLFNHSLSFLW